MVLIIFMPGFGIHDCPSYYKNFLRHMEREHTVQFMCVDGYTYSGCRYLGDICMATLLAECAEVCNRLSEPYVLVGHSMGALLTGHLYPRLQTKPINVVLLNPLTSPKYLRVFRGWLPLPVPVLWLLDWLPLPLNTTLYTAKTIGTDTDIVTKMKFRLWRDLATRACVTEMQTVLPKNTTIVTSTRDPLGQGAGAISGLHHELVHPGHASFRWMACTTIVSDLLLPTAWNHGLFEDLFPEQL
jgi:pimeloyl-ACP methyl ester carboxylesterase